MKDLGLLIITTTYLVVSASFGFVQLSLLACDEELLTVSHQETGLVDAMTYITFVMAYRCQQFLLEHTKDRRLGHQGQ